MSAQQTCTKRLILQLQLFKCCLSLLRDEQRRTSPEISGKTVRKVLLGLDKPARQV